MSCSQVLLLAVRCYFCLKSSNLLKGLENPMMSCSLSPYVDDAKVADVVIPHVLRRPHVQGPQYMHKFLLVDRSSEF